jgi:Phage-related protein, tail component
MAKPITGGKGGSSNSRTPTEQPDDLQSVAKAKILIALGEGEFAGGLTAKDIYLDGTALENSDGSENFSGVTWEFRPGTQAQKYIQGIPGADNEINVGTTVSSDTAWTHTFTNTQLSAIRLRLKWPSLFKQEDDGDLVGYSVKYAVDLQTDGGAWNTVLDTSVTGKTTSGYERSHRIDLPSAGSTWTVRLRKITTDANSAKIGDTMTLQSYTEVIDAKLRYPNTALLYIEFDSSQFNGSIPQIACEPRGRIIRVPDTYDPETRTYSGTWAGTFKWAWTDNPAWIFYDLVVSDRFGLGNRLTAANIDKWTLYQVAQYCDQMVPDGKGGSGTEPRYTCNVYIQERNDAYTVLRDFAAIFRGMTYWGDDQIVCLADMPRDVDFTYTHANVIDGKFTYSSSTTKSRYTNALVSWSDPANAYSDAMEPVFEQALLARYGFNQLEITAIGCTRQSEANRKGRWGILTNNKDRVVTFSVGEDGNIPQPGYTIAISDRDLSGRDLGGRISAVNGRVLTLDRAPGASAGDRMIINLPSGISQSRTIQAVSGNKVTVTTAYSETPAVQGVWIIESDELYAQQYRVVTVTDNDDGTFTITGANHDPDKYARIDTGAIIDQRPISVIPPGNQSAPTNIVIDSYSVVNQGISLETMRVTWGTTSNAIAYEAQWRRNDGNWINVPRSSTTSFEVASIYSGRYLVRVRAINASEISSGWGYSEEKTLTGKVGNPPKPVGFTASENVVFGIELNWGFPANTGDTLKTEIQYSLTGSEDDAMLLADVPYPQRKYQQMGLKAGQIFWFRAQLVDKSGNESGYIEWVRGQASVDVSDITDAILDDMKESEVFKDLIENAVDTSEKVAGMADDIKQAVDDLEQQAKDIQQNADGLAQAEVKIDEISLSVDGMTGGVRNSAIAIIQNGLAQVATRKTLSATVAGNSAELDRIDQVMVDEKTATAQSLLSLQTDVNGNKASINSLSQTVSNYQQATATQINSLTASIDGHTAAITTNANAIADVNGKMSAMYSIKVGLSSNGQYYAAGMGIGVENTPSGMQSQVVFLADRFAVTTAVNGTTTLPFVIQNGQTFIRDTFIGNASITNAKIADAAITNAKISGNISSTGYKVSGVGGWLLSKADNNLTFVNGSGAVMVQLGRITGNAPNV